MDAKTIFIVVVLPVMLVAIAAIFNLLPGIFPKRNHQLMIGTSLGAFALGAIFSSFCFFIFEEKDNTDTVILEEQNVILHQTQTLYLCTF